MLGVFIAFIVLCCTWLSFLVHNYCGKNPCMNGGQCTNGETGYECKCAHGYIGHDCRGNTTSQFQHNILSWSICDAILFLDFDICLENPCENGGTCNRIKGGQFICKCNHRYRGVTCEGENHQKWCKIAIFTNDIPVSCCSLHLC